MSRIAARFSSLNERGRTALIPFVTAGDPNPDVTVGLMRAMVNAGADIIELGVPFSDPIADGPVIQRASERALVHHVSLTEVMEMVGEFRASDQETPVVLMGYLNPIEIMGYQNFAQRAADAGVDGVLIVDIPPEEGAELREHLRRTGIDPIFLLAPTTTEERISRIAGVASGFVYYVSFKGVTGASHLNVNAVSDKLKIIRKHTKLPVGVGFGIKDPETAAAVAQVSDAVVVGSALVACVEKLADRPAEIAPEIAELLASMRAAMDAS